MFLSFFTGYGLSPFSAVLGKKVSQPSSVVITCFCFNAKALTKLYCNYCYSSGSTTLQPVSRMKYTPITSPILSKTSEMSLSSQLG